MGALWLGCFIYVGLWQGHEIAALHRKAKEYPNDRLGRSR